MTILLDLNITPVGKPRMTQRDKWKRRPAVVRYWRHKDELRDLIPEEFEMPEGGYELIAFFPMPKSWSLIKRAEMEGAVHQVKPDKDNIEKAFLDAVCPNDQKVWNGETSKYWATEGRLVLRLKSREEIFDITRLEAL